MGQETHNRHSARWFPRVRPVGRNCSSSISLGVAMVALMAYANIAGAELARVVSYDVDDTPVSGFGCWFHDFAGTIVDTGRTVGGSVICSTDGIGHVLNYKDGVGTLNDTFSGNVPNAKTQLFLLRPDNSVPPKTLAPVIRLHLDAPYKVEQIRLLRGQNGFTTITGVTVEIEGAALPFTPTQIVGADPLSVSVSLVGLPLADTPTKQVTLKNFGASFFGYPIDQFGIGEVEIVGTKATVFPTSKDQCKDGGWKNYGFRNQGQCVSYVNHH